MSLARASFVTELVIWLEICSSPSAICLHIAFPGALAVLGHMELALKSSVKARSGKNILIVAKTVILFAHDPHVVFFLLFNVDHFF